MRTKTWVRIQFELFKKHKGVPRYREVLIVTSFIETVIRNEALNSKCKQAKSFKRSLEILGLTIDNINEKKTIYKQNCQYKKDCLKKINAIRIQRNELLHDILGKRLPNKYIENTIKKMAKNIELICTKSNLIRNYFVSNFGFDPAELV